MPEITVVLPVYNGMPYLPVAVDSILSQTFTDFTFLIVNDGSTDDTGDYLKSVKDHRVQLVSQPNRGLGKTLNTGIEMCETEFLARMDADDISLPNRLEKQLNFLHQNLEVGALGTQITYFVNNNHEGFGPTLYQKHEDIYSALFNFQHALCHASIMFRTSALKEMGGYRISGIGEEWDLFLRLGENTHLANLNEVLYMVRIHAESVAWTRWRECRRKTAYACDCARRRSKGLPEINLDTYIAEKYPDSFWGDVIERIDAFGNIQYRKAIGDILKGQKITGSIRMLMAAFCAPSRAFRRVKRELSRFIS